MLQKTHTKFSFLNAHTANIAFVDPEYRNSLKKFEVLSDGLGVDICSLINYGKKFPDNLNGTDFIPSLLNHLEGSPSVALLGAAPGIANLAVQHLQTQFPKIKFSVIGHGYYEQSEKQQILTKLCEIKPDILLVAFGNPAQEKWIAENCNAENCTLAFGVGAFFDFAAGRVPRAPRLLRYLRLEWIYRLVLEPKRMWVRYVYGNPLFLVRSLKQKLGFGHSGFSSNE